MPQLGGAGGSCERAAPVRRCLARHAGVEACRFVEAGRRVVDGRELKFSRERLGMQNGACQARPSIADPSVSSDVGCLEENGVQDNRIQRKTIPPLQERADCGSSRVGSPRFRIWRFAP